jgi:hypothetical protein
MSPVNKNLAKSLIKKYGILKGKKIYSGMESENKPTFKKGLKTAKKEGHTLKHFPKRKKYKKITGKS